MSQPAPASSILEFLTYPNPNVKHVKPKSKKLTTSPNYYFPTQVLPWDEFDVHLLETIYDGNLIQALHQQGHVLPTYPRLSPLTDLEIRTEGDTRSLIRKWNETIVTAALEPIQQDFYPVIWSRGDNPKENEQFDVPPRRPGSRSQPPRQASNKSRKRKKQSLSRLRPDSGSSAWCLPNPSSDPVTTAPADRRERFPKEYKVSTKWKSKAVLDGNLLNEEGEWEDGQHANNLAMPINQAFTYCVANRCRYGSILTCEEAFIFRIKPRDKGECSGSESEADVIQDLMDDGLMEFVSIPWTNHRNPDDSSEKIWTINLALWFVHILAGNRFEAARSYDSLITETLGTAPSAQVTEPLADTITDTGNDGIENDESDSDDSTNSNDTIPIDISPFIRKRKLESLQPDEDDAYELSFAKRSFISVAE